jgi:hypothetical protein
MLGDWDRWPELTLAATCLGGLLTALRKGWLRVGKENTSPSYIKPSDSGKILDALQRHGRPMPPRWQDDTGKQTKGILNEHVMPTLASNTNRLSIVETELAEVRSSHGGLQERVTRIETRGEERYRAIMDIIAEAKDDISEVKRDVKELLLRVADRGLGR